MRIILIQLTGCLLWALAAPVNGFTQDSLLRSYADADLVSGNHELFYEEARLVQAGAFNEVQLFDRKNGLVARIAVAQGRPYFKDGPVSGQYASRQPWFRGSFRANRLNGAWQSWYGTGQPCDSGTLRSQVPDGPWRSWYPNGQLRFYAEFSARLLDDLEKQMKAIADRNFHSKIVAASFGDGDLQFYKSLYEDMRKAINPSSVTGPSPLLSLFYRLQYNNDNPGDRYIPPFNQAVLQGVFISYFPDGALADSGSYTAGRRTGLWTEHSEIDGSTGHGFYLNGVRSGDWKYFDAQGRLRFIDRYTRKGRYKGRLDVD